MTKGRKIDMETADDAVILDTADLMVTLGRSRETIRRHMRNGILPPPLDRAGGSYRWTVGLIREWQRMRTAKAIERFSLKPKSVKLFTSHQSSSEFG